jgi:hypothetical protein
MLQLMKKKIFAGIFTVLVVIAGFIPLFVVNLQNKFEGDKVTSSRVRLYDFVEQFLVIKDYFLTGVGMDSGEYAFVRTKYQLTGDLASLSFNGEEVGSTNSVMFMLGAMGIIMGGLWLLAYTMQQFVPAKLLPWKEKVILIIFLLISISVEPLLLKTFFVTLMFSGMLFTFINSKYPQVKSLWKSEF